MADKSNVSVKTGVLVTAALIRGPVADPQAELETLLVVGAAETSVGKASSDSVSTGAGGVLGFTGAAGC